MKKLFLILLLITIASTNSHAMVDKTVRCISLFSSGNASMHINDMIAPFEVKKNLLKQAIQNKGIREFIIEYSNLTDRLYVERFTEAIRGKASIDYVKLGFKSIHEIRTWKETIIAKQIKILSIMDPIDMTPEFALDFKRILTRMYNQETTKEEVLTLNNRLDSIILMYKSQADRFTDY